MKKALAMVLSLVMLLTVLTACGSGNGGQNSPQPSGNDTPSNSEPSGSAQPGDTSNPGEVKKIIFTYATPGVEPTDMRKVQDKLNEMTVRDIGVEVEFLPISVFELASTVPNKVIAGEQIDVFAMLFTGSKIFQNMNLLQPLDEYLTEENAPYVVANEGALGTYDKSLGTVYAITGPATVPSCGGFIICKDDLDDAGLGDQYHDYDAITLDDLGDIFAAIKAVYPEKYPCGILGSSPRAAQTFYWDALSDSVSSGALIGMDSTTVENYYASEPYKNYLEHVRDWYLKEYIPKDAATTDISLTDYLSQGVISGYFNDFKDSKLKDTHGKDFVYLQLIEPYHASVADASTMSYGVPATAKEPEAAVRFIDYLLGSADAANLLTFGIEGEHWVPADPEHGVATYPEGVDKSSTGYDYGFGFYCNRALDGVYVNFGAYDPSVKSDAEVMDLAKDNYTKGCGAHFDSSAWTAQLQQIDTVVAQYKAALECGSADLDTVYPEFLAALEANGINDVIAAKQAWFQEWLANQ